MDFPPEILCMVKSSLPNQDLFHVELTCRYLFWCTVSNKEWQLRKCQLWDQSKEQIISEFKEALDYCSHVLCWKYRCQYLSLEDVRSWNNWALRKAAENGHLPVVQYLCEKFQLTIQDVRSRDNEALRMAASRGHLQVVQYLCEYHDRENRQLTIQDVRSDNNWALRGAAGNGHLAVVQFLCEKFQLTLQDVRTWNNRALLGAAMRGHLPVVQFLCEYRDRENRQLTIQDVRSSFALWYACRNGHLPIVQYLCQKYSIVE
jgi:hypothetical protein